MKRLILSALIFTLGCASGDTLSHPPPFPATQLDAYITALMQRTHVPGTAVVVVRNNSVIYARGFGVRALGKPEPITPDTLMMIGSVGKGMTTLMMATLVDDGTIAWDTAAVKIDPQFAVSDAALTPKVTLRDLVCNCTGAQRHDVEMNFTGKPSTAREVIDSVRTLPFTGQYGKTFGYINQMVAAGGYLAAMAAGPADDPLASYVLQMRKRVFTPIGMNRTTFSFDAVEADGNAAAPHGVNAIGAYVPIPMSMERMLEPLAPAGGSWSTANEMARYAMTQLSGGVAPGGRRVVSTANLEVTRRPNVQAAPGAFYGLGWGIGEYKGQRFLSHGGGTEGFTSDLSLLPDSGIGVVVLSNAQNADLYVRAVRARAIELVLGLLMERDASIRTQLDQMEREASALAKAVVPEASEAKALEGSYVNGDLGPITLSVEGGRLTFHSAHLASELRRLDATTYVAWDPPLAGLLLRPAPGGLTIVSHDADQPGEWVFARQQGN